MEESSLNCIERISKALNQAKVDEVQRSIFVLYGPRGVGKSTLLEGIWADYERTIPGSLVDLQKLDWHNTGCALCQLLIQVVGDIAQRLPLYIVSLPADYENSEDSNQLTDYLLGLVQAAGKYEKPILLLLDNYDVMPAELKSGFETKVLHTLSRTNKVIVVLSSEFEEKFQSNFDLRMRYESFELSGLSSEAIGHEFKDYTELAPEIHQLTGGLPGLTKALVELLDQLNIKNVQDFQLNYHTIFERYYNTIVPQTVGKYILPNIRDTLLALSLLRRFDLRILQQILSSALPDAYLDYNPIDYLNLIEELGNWVEWYSPRNGYVVNKAYQPVLSGYMWSNFPDRYKNVHRSALTLYRDLLQNEYRASYVTEMLYHRLILLLSEHGCSWMMPRGDINIAIDEFLKDINGKAMTKITEDDLLALYRALTQDEDLMTYLSQKDVRVILSTLYESSKGIPAPIELFMATSVTSS